VNKTLIILAVVAVVGGGIFLYTRRARADGAVLPGTPTPDPAGVPDYAVTGVPSRVAQKRQAGAGMASTSTQMRPELPPVVQTAVDAYKRGSDAVASGKAAAQAFSQGNIDAGANAVADVFSSGNAAFAGAKGIFGSQATNRSDRTGEPSGKTAALGAGAAGGGGSIMRGGRQVSDVQDRQGNVFSAAKYADTAEFQKLRAAADAAETRANTGMRF
jgi:hypothetical protein